MTYSRQRLYDTNNIGFIKSYLSGQINQDENTAKEWENSLHAEFQSYTGIPDLIPLSRGRLAVYFAVKYTVSKKKNKVLMSPFTIFDLVNMIRVAGGEPEFIDSDCGTVHLSPEALEDEIDDTTAAVIVTHYHSSNRHIKKIAELCKKYDVKLIEDCAISLGSRVDGQHVGTFGDFALFSFGLFKFVSTYFGGGLVVKSDEIRSEIISELYSWPRMEGGDMYPYFFKGISLTILTHPTVFNIFTFPLFRFGYLHDIKFIKEKAQNDPSPLLRDSLPTEFMRRPSLFQLKEFTRQIPLVEADRQKRLANAERYYDKLFAMGIPGLPEKPGPIADCFLNYPIQLEKDRNHFVVEMMRSGFDLAIYYYRNCADIEEFKCYYKELPNISHFVSNMVIFPVYPGISSAYIDDLTTRAGELLV